MVELRSCKQAQPATEQFVERIQVTGVFGRDELAALVERNALLFTIGGQSFVAELCKLRLQAIGEEYNTARPPPLLRPRACSPQVASFPINVIRAVRWRFFSSLAMLRRMTPPPIRRKLQLVMCAYDSVSHSFDHVPQLF